jgi:prepilin-type N-terminal cleavage/methylation domain-containing protein
MKQSSKSAATAAFTLLEITVVLVIIGLLIAIAIPGAKSLLKHGQITNVTGTAASLDKAVLGLVTKSGGPAYPPITSSSAAAAFPLTGTLGGANGSTLTAACTLDNVLITEGLLQSPINVNIGTTGATPTGSHPMIWNPGTNTFSTVGDVAPDFNYSGQPHSFCALSTTNVPGTDGTNYLLDNSGTNLAANTRVVTFVIPNVAIADAAAIADKRDNITNASTVGANTTGTVTYAAPNAAGLTTVYIHIAHY